LRKGETIGVPVNMQVTRQRLWNKRAIATVVSSKLYRLPVLLILSLCLCSHLSAAYNPPQPLKSIKLFSVVAGNQQFTSSPLLNTLPGTESTRFAENFAEEQEDDDNKKAGNLELKSSFVNTRIYAELFSSLYLKNCLRQLNLQKATLPFISYFILYHTWKSHLA
jgi:hypothetical protein